MYVHAIFRPRGLAVLAGAVLLAGGAARADCGAPASDAERAACIGGELRASDAVINQKYSALQGALDAPGQAALRHQEIAWIKARAAACGVDLKESDREKWFASLLADYSKTVCVVRYTDRRVGELSAQLAGLGAKRPAAPAAMPFSPPPAAGGGQEVYDVVARGAPVAGKWYFEVMLKPSEIAAGSATIFVGVQSGGANAGTLQSIRRRDIGRPPRRIGIAVDLDEGKLYIRANGAWQSPPGSAGGIDLKLGRAYLGKVSSSVSLTPFLDGGQIEVNFGQHGFAYALPDGYIPLDMRGPRRVVDPG